MENFKDKYLKYKNKYETLKKEKLINLIGGLCDKNKKFDYDDLSSVLDYAKNKYECSGINKTKKKYIVILYGPPASGKTIARKIGCMNIKKYFNEDLSSNEIYESFIDTSDDDIVYDAYYKEEQPNISIKDKLITLLNNFFKTKNIPDDKKLDYLKTNMDNPELKSVMDINIGIYRKYRTDRNIDDLSALLGVIGTYTNKNIFFEIASPYIDYINNLISTIYWLNYNVIFIYPHTNNINLLVERNYLRGLLEGRVLTKDFIELKSIDCSKKYVSDVINESNQNSIINKHKNIMILRYDTDLSTGLYEELNKFNTSDDFEQNYILDHMVKIDNKLIYKKITSNIL